MTIDIQPATSEDKSVLSHLMELYQYDFSEFEGTDVNAHGLFGYPYLDHYWREPGRYPFLIRVSGKLAGFALVRAIHGDEAGTNTHIMAEFFILRKYRTRGVGQNVAQRTFAMFPGKWRVYEEAENLPAQAFWRKVIARYTGGAYAEVHEDGWSGPIQEFNTSCTTIPAPD
jgi:predicted acetyltransferase